ncbi:MAG TPA: CBS domain-containing protein [Dissulfurispiraceae bacterium]|nr:CBS domain-containing protein [Dissulfurispiraceae bacterium]
MKVEDIMTTKLFSVGAGANLKAVMKLMANHNVRSVLVKPKAANDIPGVISIRDVVFKIIAKGVDPEKVKVGTLASKPLIFVDKDMDVKHAAMMMNRFNIARVWVKEGNTVVGVVALLDVLKAALK